MQKYPELTKPLYFLGIPITPMCYIIDSKMTNAQVELLVSDTSYVDYKTDRKKKTDFDSTPADTESIIKTNEEWKERFGDDESKSTGLSMKDILGADIKEEDSIGVKID